MGAFTIYCGKEFRTLCDLELQIEEAHKAAGKTLIGTCGDCRHWVEYSLTGRCLIRPEYQAWEKDDGCKKWKEKEESCQKKE